MLTNKFGFCFDVTGRTNFFSEPLSDALNCNIFSCKLRGNKSLGVRLIRFLCYVRNLTSLVVLPKRDDWVVYNIPKFFVLEAITIRYFTRGKFILLVHNKNLHHDTVADWRTYFFLASFDRFICHSPDVRTAVLRLLPHADVLLTPIPSAGFLAPGVDSNQKQRNKSDPVAVGFVGQLRRQKGADLFYDAAVKLLDCHPNLMRFVMAGEPIDFYPKNDRFKESEIIIVDRFLEDQELDEVLRGLDVIVAPYRNSSGSAICAMAAYYELSIIASNLDVFKYMETHYPFITIAEMKTADEVYGALLLNARCAAENVGTINWSQIRESMSFNNYAGRVAKHFGLTKR